MAARNKAKIDKTIELDMITEHATNIGPISRLLMSDKTPRQLRRPENG